MKIKHFLVAMLVLCLVLAGCSNSSNSSKDSDKKMKARLIIVKARITNLCCSEFN